MSLARILPCAVLVFAMPALAEPAPPKVLGAVERTVPSLARLFEGLLGGGRQAPDFSLTWDKGSDPEPSVRAERIDPGRVRIVLTGSGWENPAPSLARGPRAAG